MPLDLLSFLEYSNYNFRASNLLCQEDFIAYAVNMCILFTYSEGQTFVLDRFLTPPSWPKDWYLWNRLP